MGNLLIRKKIEKKEKKIIIRQVAREETLVPSLTLENKGLKIGPLNGQKEEKSLGLFLVIKRQGKREFFLPLGSANLGSKPEKKKTVREKRGRKEEERKKKGKKKEETLGFFYLKVCSWFVWFLLMILMVE